MAAGGAQLATAWVALKVSTEGVQGDLTNELGPAAEKAGADAGGKAGKSMSAGMKTALVAGAAVAVAGLVSVFTTGLQELKFGEEVSAQTDLLAKNTGFTMATADVEKYAQELSNLSGQGDEELQQAGNSLIKFGDLSEDNYKKALASVNDLAAGGKDLGGVSEALGKALADPANAAGLLKRQGVILNDEQKTLIDNFTAVGDKAGAQGVILDALEGTYGGAAEAAGGTLSGKLAILQNSFENLAGDVVTLVMPAITGLVTVFQGVVAFFSQNQAALIAVGVVIGTVLVVAFLAWAAAIWATTVALLANPITWIILAIVALIAIIVLLVMNWDAVVAFLVDVWNNVVNWLVATFNNIMHWWNDLWTTVWVFIQSVWNNIQAWLMQAVANIVSGLIGFGRNILNWWNGLWTEVGNFFRDSWNGIVAIVSGIGQFFGDAFSNVASIVKGAFSGVVGVIRGVVNNIIGIVNGAIDGINGLTSAAAAVGVSIPKIPHLPGLAKGGTVTGAGSVIVGENGPELLNLPKGASVNPDIPDFAGGGVFNLYDADNILIGTMHGAAASAVASNSRDTAVSLQSGRRRN